MKLGRAETAILLFTLVLLVIFAGYMIITNTGNEQFTISTSRLPGQDIIAESIFEEVYDTEIAEQDSEAEVQAAESGVPVGQEGSSGVDAKININTAEHERLMELPRIGEVLANRIIAYREENGPFETPEEIMCIEGIGEIIFEGLVDMITILD